MKTTMKLPRELAPAYDWVRAAGELDLLRGLDDDELDLYAEAAARNAAEHDVHDITEVDVWALGRWLQRATHS